MARSRGPVFPFLARGYDGKPPTWLGVPTKARTVKKCLGVSLWQALPKHRRTKIPPRMAVQPTGQTLPDGEPHLSLESHAALLAGAYSVALLSVGVKPLGHLATWRRRRRNTT
jgi:hypothetical protein